MTKIQDEFKALYANQKLLTVLVFSLVTVLVWVGASLFRSQRKTSISPELQELAAPLNPSINAEILTEIEQKRQFSPSELADFPIYVLRDRDAATRQTAPAATSPTPTATPVAEPESSLDLTEAVTADQSTPISTNSTTLTPTP